MPPAPLLDRVARVSSCRGQQRRTRRRLFDFDTHCYWCAIPTTWITPEEATTCVLLPHTATLDHLLLARHRQGLGLAEAVLACHACNQFRARLGAYQAKLWPLAESQVQLLTSMRSLYLTRLETAISIGLQVPGRDRILAEYQSAISSLTAVASSVFTAPRFSPLTEQDLVVLHSRIHLQSLLPITL